MILDSGTVLEYDSVDNLLANEKSQFVQIVETSFGVSLNDVLNAKRNKDKENDKDNDRDNASNFVD